MTAFAGTLLFVGLAVGALPQTLATFATRKLLARGLAAASQFALRAHPTRRLRRGRIFLALEGGLLVRLVVVALGDRLRRAAGKDGGGENAHR